VRCIPTISISCSSTSTKSQLTLASDPLPPPDICLDIQARQITPLHVMFAADFSWRESGAEKVGERRQRKARERAATPSGYASTSSGPSNASSSYLAKSSTPLAEKISLAFRKPILGGRRQKLPSEQPVFRIERVPTLLQQKNREPVRWPAQESPSAKHGSPSDEAIKQAYQNISSTPHRVAAAAVLPPSPSSTPLGPRDTTNQQWVDDAVKLLRISTKEDADEFCQAYDQVQERIYELQHAPQAKETDRLRSDSPKSNQVCTPNSSSDVETELYHRSNPSTGRPLRNPGMANRSIMSPNTPGFARLLALKL
jgi:hypothetical protein